MKGNQLKTLTNISLFHTAHTHMHKYLTSQSLSYTDHFSQRGPKTKVYYYYYQNRQWCTFSSFSANCEKCLNSVSVLSWLRGHILLVFVASICLIVASICLIKLRLNIPDYIYSNIMEQQWVIITILINQSATIFTLNIGCI